MKSPYFSLKRQIIFDLLDKFPDASTRVLAKIAYRDNPAFFKDIEDARSIIRVYRGQSGNKLREEIKMKKYYKVEI
jgi:hypothetical protein